MLMASPSTRRLPMETPGQHPDQQQQHQQQNQQPLKCPRCDSSNTKFCYYNNYSLSQPRHFCKACKRYWTRGGTLRNVPVGGGCRKNKRVRRPSASSTSVSAATAKEPPQPVVARSSVDVSTPGSSAHVNPLFFDMGGISFPRFHSTVDLPPHIPSALGLGFSSPGFMSSEPGCGDNNYIQDLVSSGPVLSGGFSSDRNRCTNPSMIAPILGSAAPAMTTSSVFPTMASLLASTIQQQKFFSTDIKEIQAPGDFKGFSSENELAVKDVKVEGLNLPGWSFGCQNQMDLSNPLPHYWNMSNNIGTWHDPTNTGSSVPSLI